MRLVIPFAAPLSGEGRPALQALALPALQAWLAAGTAELERDDGDEASLTPPHERVLARALGLAGADGRLPWAAQRMPADGRDPGDLAWGLLTPVHWQVGSEQVVLADPDDLQLTDDDSRALFDAAHPLLADAGYALVWGAALRWYLAHETLAELPTASLDRAIGRSVDAWLPARDAPGARALRRLQNELQMLWHEHPVNRRREAAGLAPVNSCWLSGCGMRPKAMRALPAGFTVDDRLRRPALAEDWGTWIAAWREIDQGPVAALARDPRGVLTLCGERSALTLAAAQRPWWKRWVAPAPPQARALLEAL